MLIKPLPHCALYLWQCQNDCSTTSGPPHGSARPLVRHIISCKIMPWEPRPSDAPRAVILPSSHPPIATPVPPVTSRNSLHEAASSLELLPQSLAMGQHPTATNAQSSQIISFNVNTKPARSHRSQPPL